MDTTNKPFSSFETRIMIGAATAAVAIVGGALLYAQASASPATIADAPAPVTPAPAEPVGPFMPDLVGIHVADAQAELDALGITSTATDTCAVNGCHTAIVECNDGKGGWIDVRDTGAERIGEQEFEPGTDLAGVNHVDLITYDYCPFGSYEHPVVELEMPAEPLEPVTVPAPTPESVVEPSIEDDVDEDDNADADDESDDSDEDDDDE